VYEFRNSRIKVGHDDDLWNLFERINHPWGGGGRGRRNDTKIRQAWPACDCGGSDTALTSLSICAYVCPPPGARWAGLYTGLCASGLAWASHNPHC
jgi:hypothetical protein